MKKKTEKTEEKRPFFNTTNFVVAVVCLVAFLAVGLTAHYLTADEFASGQLMALQAVLSLVGALAVLFRFYRFAVLYYVGCGAGLALGIYVGGLKGSFAPTAGTICTVAFILIFTAFGALAQWKTLRKLVADHRAAKAREKEERQDQELDRARLEREEAAALMNDAFGVEDGVDVTTPAAALDQAARLAFAEEEPAQLVIPEDRLEAVGEEELSAPQPVQPEEPFVPAAPAGPMGRPAAPAEAEKTAAAPVGTAADQSQF